MSLNKKPRLFLTTMTSLSAILQPIKDITISNSFSFSNNPKVIGTHDGSFHCDEALAISMLKLLPEYKDSPVLRTRNPELLSKCSIVVDVGAEYLPEKLRFDHHQREFDGILDGWNTKLSSAGLVYKHFGKDIISSVLKDSQVDISKNFIDICYKKVYEGFIEHIDAIDNGIAVSDQAPRYHVSTTLSNRVGYLNPSWNEPNTPEAFNTGFSDAMMLVGSEFIGCIERIALSWWPARSIVQNAVDDRMNIHASGKVILLENQCPWKDHLFDIEKEKGIIGEILYAIYQDSGGSWRIQAVPVDPNSFSSRKKLLEPFGGLRDDNLSEKIGIPGSIFIHASGFIGGHQTRQGAIDMAVKSICS